MCGSRIRLTRKRGFIRKRPTMMKRSTMMETTVWILPIYIGIWPIIASADAKYQKKDKLLTIFSRMEKLTPTNGFFAGYRLSSNLKILVRVYFQRTKH